MARHLDHFRLDAELSRGGAGVVHRGWDTRLERAVAIKLLHPFSDDEDLVRFQREARLATELRHPNVVGVHWLGVSDGHPYLVLELVQGGSLLARIRQGLLNTETALAIGEPLAEALAHAHRLGVLHRDVKPANVLLDGDRVLLTDFGLARSEASRALTQTGTALGTPGYMAPEQALGDTVGPPCDVFGWGATLYHCLTGHAPFEGRTPVAIMENTVNASVRPPSVHGVEVAPPLEDLLMRCLASDPRKRPRDGNALLGELRRLARPEASQEFRPPGKAPKATAVLALAAFGLAGALGIFWRAERQQVDRLRAQLAQATQDPAPDSPPPDVQDPLSDPPSGDVHDPASPALPVAQELAAVQSLLLSHQLSVGRRLLEQLTPTTADERYAWNLVDAQLLGLEGEHAASLKVFRALCGERPQDPEAWVGQAHTLLGLGRVEACRTLLDNPPERLAPARLMILQGRCQIGVDDTAAEILLRDARFREDVSRFERYEANLAFGELYFAQSKWAPAFMAFGCALGDRSDPVLHLRHARLLNVSGHRDLAIAHLNRALLDQPDPETEYQALIFLTIVQASIARFDEAEQHLARALERHPRSPETLTARGALAHARVLHGLAPERTGISDATPAPGALDGALAAYDEAIQSDPDYWPALAMRSVARILIGDLEGGNQDNQRAQKLVEGKLWSFRQLQWYSGEFYSYAELKQR